jgi:hypothetical protein
MDNDKSKASSNYETAFYEAQNFLIASEAIRKKMQSVMFTEDGMNKSIGLQYVMYVNHAFAVELLLKCIMIMETGRYYTGHHLFDLFLKLPEKTRQRITAIFGEYGIRRRDLKYFGMFEEVDLVTVLQEAKSAFMQFRYLFENREAPRYDLNTVVECLEYYIFTVKPELKNLKYT